MLINKEKITAFFKKVWEYILTSVLPNRKDNLKTIAIKITFLASLAMLIISSSYLAIYFFNNVNHERILNDAREIKKSQPQTGGDRYWIKQLQAENPDFKGWIKIPGTNIDNPIYQTADNDFYLTHNQLKQRDSHGALFFDYRNVITSAKIDKNLVIYGHNMKNGSMFGTLSRLRSLPFYKENPTIEFATPYDSGIYKIYSIFILNASKSDDNGYIYNITRQNFIDEDDFDAWTAEAYERSLIITNVDVQYGDDIITLVTCVNDFKDARLVVMARKTRDFESSVVDTSKASINPSPRYPKRWYDERNQRYPY